MHSHSRISCWSSRPHISLFTVDADQSHSINIIDAAALPQPHLSDVSAVRSRQFTSLFACDRLATFIISAKWTEWMAEMLFSSNVCLSVCLCAADRSIRPVWALNASSSETVKLRTSNLAYVFPGTVWTWPSDCLLVYFWIPYVSERHKNLPSNRVLYIFIHHKW